jgi:hypothetical protein
MCSAEPAQPALGRALGSSTIHDFALQLGFFPVYILSSNSIFQGYLYLCVVRLIVRS